MSKRNDNSQTSLRSMSSWASIVSTSNTNAQNSSSPPLPRETREVQSSPKAKHQKHRQKHPTQSELREENVFDFKALITSLPKSKRGQKKAKTVVQLGTTPKSLSVPKKSTAAPQPLPSKKKATSNKKKKPSAMKRAIVDSKQAISSQVLESSHEDGTDDDNGINDIHEALTDEVSDTHDHDEMMSAPDADATLVSPSRPIFVTDVPELHSGKFREYCTHMLSTDLDKLVTKFLQTILRFGKNAIERNPIKARANPRFVIGLTQCLKQAKRGNLQVLYVVPDIVRCDLPKGPDDILKQALDRCQEAGIPVVFTHKKRTLGYPCKRKGNVSAVGILNYDGANDQQKAIFAMVDELTQLYQTRRQEILTSRKQQVQ